MALIVGFHTIATQLPTTTATNIVEGMGVELSAVSGAESKVQRKQTSGGNTIGIAGDSKNTTGPNKPYGASLVVNAAGGTRATQNRVSDFFDETVGAGKITIYTGIGEFYTDQYTGSFTVGSAVYADISTGKITATSTNNGNKIGLCIDGPRAYPSGVPGVDDSGVTNVTASVNGSLSLGTYLRFYMNIVP